MSDSLKGLAKALHAALQDGNTDYVMQLFNDSEHQDEIKNNSSDVIHAICCHLTFANQRTNPEVFDCCLKLINTIGVSSNTEDVLLQLVTEIEESKDTSKFAALLEPLYAVLLRTSPKKYTSFCWCFNAIQTFLCNSMLPDFRNTKGTERFVVDGQHCVNNIAHLYERVIVFYNKCQTFVESEDQTLRNVIRKFLMQLLGNVFSHMNAERWGLTMREGKMLSEQIIERIFQSLSVVDPIALAELWYDRDPNDFTRADIYSLANYMFLIYSEGIHYMSVPKVYTPQFVLISSLHLATSMLESGNMVEIENSIKLTLRFLRPIATGELPYYLLACEHHPQFCTVVTNIIIYNYSEKLRKAALQMFIQYLLRFEPKALYTILYNLVTIINHSGMKGFLITIYKDSLDKHFSEKSEDLLPFYRGPKMFRLLRKFCHLEEMENTNFMDNSDQIISALNLIRYIILKDKNNITQLKDFVPVLEEIFLDPLRKGLELSKAHYDLEIHNINNEEPGNEKALANAYGAEFPKMNKLERLNFLKMSRTVLDVISSLLVRVTEVIEN
ncbi:glomulin-like isoform X1 [Euwallacea fornicatus]|uniref:glomulin-like isoform X1 n=1 Tax=Euwallacea fornicatus TaxID=995702 RepID=UPI00338EB533